MGSSALSFSFHTPGTWLWSSHECSWLVFSQKTKTFDSGLKTTTTLTLIAGLPSK